jgi:hypothetical protein
MQKILAHLTSQQHLQAKKQPIQAKIVGFAQNYQRKP